MILAYLSVTGQIKKFIDKLPECQSFEITNDNVYTEMNEPFIVIVPTYVKEVTEVVNDFLETGNNLSYCIGVCGSGNRNFGDLFCFTARDLCRDYGLKNILEFEFQGTDNDVEYLQEWIQSFEAKLAEDGLKFIHCLEKRLKD